MKDRIYTAGDARREKHWSDQARFPEVASIAPLPRPTSPAVGMLCREGKAIYYAFVRGIYIESTNPRAVETCLTCQDVG